MNFTAFYALPKDDRWLDNPHEVGGSSTDVAQVGYSLAREIKNRFPINMVPENIADALRDMQRDLDHGEKGVETVIRIMSETLVKERLE